MTIPILQEVFWEVSPMGMKLHRRSQLVEATISEIGANGSLDVTVGQIARRAGVSPALAFHYFGDKDQLFLAAMRHILTIYGSEIRDALRAAETPRGRLEALVHASFSPTNFRPDVISAWLNFYVLAQRSNEARRLLSIYHRRLRSNLLHELRPLAGERADDIAQRIGGLIDGLYLRSAINPRHVTGKGAITQVMMALERETGRSQ